MMPSKPAMDNLPVEYFSWVVSLFPKFIDWLITAIGEATATKPNQMFFILSMQAGNRI
jgi:hypothetical protein